MLKKIMGIILAAAMIIGTINVFAAVDTVSGNDSVNGGYVMPDIYNTGYVSDFDELVDFAEKYPQFDGYTITESGVYEGFKVEGTTLYIKADNVTLKDFYISTENDYAVNISSGTNTVIEDGEITNVDSCGILGSGFTARRLYVHDVKGDLLKGFSNTVFESCYLSDAGMNPEAHADGIQISQGSNIKILGCRIDMPSLPGTNVSNAPIFVKADQSNISNIEVKYNWINGGGYPAGFSSTENYTVSNVVYAYNNIGNGSHYSNENLPGNCTKYGNRILSEASVGSIIVKDSNGQFVKTLDNVTDGKLDISVNLANYSLDEQSVTVQAVLIDENGEKNINSQSFTIDRYIPYSEYSKYTDTVTTALFPRNVLKNISLDSLPADMTGSAIDIRVLCKESVIREELVKGSEFTVAAVTELNIKTIDTTVFNKGCESEVSFKASADTAIEDTENIKWYVNDTEQSKSGADFVYLPTDTGNFDVYAKYGDVKSGNIRITVKPISLEGGVAVSNVLVMSPAKPVEGQSVTFEYTGEDEVKMWQWWRTSSPNSGEILKIEDDSVTNTFVVPAEYVTAGTYRVRARDVNSVALVNQYDIEISSAEVTSLTVTMTGSTVQTAGSETALVLTCVPNADIDDENEIKWYVNDTETDKTGREISYTPEGVGTYKIYAKCGDVVSNEVNVTVRAAFNYDDSKVLASNVIMSPAAPTVEDDVTFLYTGSEKIVKWQWYSTEKKGSAYIADDTGMLVMKAGSLPVSNFRIRAFDESGTRLCNASFDVIEAAEKPGENAIVLAYTGNIVQKTSELSAVSFTAAQSGVSVESEDLQWYVNDTLAYTGKSFSYTPEARGSYVIYAMLGGAKSDSITITVYPEMDIVFDPIPTVGCGGTTMTFLIDGEKASGDDFGSFSFTPPGAAKKTIKGNPVYLYNAYWSKAGECIVEAKNASGTVVYTKRFNLEKTVSVSAASQSGDILASVNGEKAENWGSSKTAEYTAGTKISLEAAGDVGSFKYWKDTESGFILSYDKKIDFIVGSEKNITAVFTDEENGFYVTFTNINGKVMTEGYESAGVTVPENPYVAGYVFEGWYSGGARQNFAVGDVVSGLLGDTVFKAGFTKNSTEYTVNINGNESICLYNDKVTASADETEGFLYWTRDGKIVSYDKEYTCYVYGNTTITAVYGETTVEKAAVVVMSEPVVLDGKIAFYAERNVPEEYEMIEAGILLHTESGITLDSYTHKAVAVSSANKGQYTVRKTNVSEGDTWYATAYVIYRDSYGNVQTVYSNEVSKTM